MDVEAGHLVQGVEHEGVLPGEDGQRNWPVAHHEVRLEPRPTESRVRGGGADEALEQDGDVEEVTEVQHEELILDSFVGEISEAYCHY